MGFSKLKTVFAGMTMLLATSLLFADAVVDKDFDNNQNEFEYYWYYYDDNAGVGDNDRPQAAPTLEASVINVPGVTEHERNGHDGKLASDTWKVKQYPFVTTEHLGKKCATMPFTMGEAWEADYCEPGEPCAMPFVGIGTMLTKEFEGIDLTGVTQLHFSIKSRVNTLEDVNVKVETLEINEFAYKPREELTGKEFGYWGKTITVSPGEWTDVTVDIPDDLVRPAWAEKIDFDIKTATKLAWEIKGDDSRMVDTLDLADVYFTGTYKFVSPSMWPKTVTTRPSANIFSTFEGQYPDASPISTYWYAYNDVEIGGNSTVSETFASKNAETGRLKIKFADQSGFNNEGKGAALEYTIGKVIPKDTIQILGFVGIGVNMYDSAASTYYDADSAGITDVYFEYMTDEGAKYVTLEVSDYHDVGDATDPTRKDSRGSGVVWYRNFPPTNGEWKQVQIPLDSLVTHSDWEGYKDIPLDKKRLAKLQWKVAGAEGTNGYYAIDNVGLPAGKFGVGVKTPAASLAKAASFNAVYNNGAIKVNWTGAYKLASGTVRLVNTRGAVVASENIASANSFTSRISAASVAAGMYFVSFEGTDVRGNAVASRTVMNIVK